MAQVRHRTGDADPLIFFGLTMTVDAFVRPADVDGSLSSVQWQSGCDLSVKLAMMLTSIFIGLGMMMMMMMVITVELLASL